MEKNKKQIMVNKKNIEKEKVSEISKVKKKLNKKEKVLSLIVYLMIAVFFCVYILQGNYEFIFYSAVALFLFFVFLWFYKRNKMPFMVFIGFSIWLFLHMLGGCDIYGQRVYGIVLLNLIGAPLYILRYDQVVHVYCYIVIGAILYYILKPRLKEVSNFVLILIALAAGGVGVLNEIIEFSAVLILGNTGVGDYYNTSLDLVANIIGSLIGVFWANRQNRK